MDKCVHHPYPLYRHTVVRGKLVLMEGNGAMVMNNLTAAAEEIVLTEIVYR